jgi:hypothetical protein
MTRTGGINQILSNRLVEFFFNEHELDEIVSDFDGVTLYRVMRSTDI